MLSSGDILGDLPADASEEEIASRLAAAGIDQETAKKMVGAVKSGGSKSEFFFKENIWGDSLHVQRYSVETIVLQNIINQKT